jgi:hypothetical protein
MERVFFCQVTCSTPRILDFSEAGEVIVHYFDYASRTVAIFRPAFPGLRPPNSEGRVLLPIRACTTSLNCGYHSGRVNSLGTIVYSLPGIWREEQVPLLSLLEADGRRVSEGEWPISTFDINQLEELVTLMTVDGREGAYLLRWSAAIDPPWS